MSLLNTSDCENEDRNDEFDNLFIKFSEELSHHEKTKVLNLLVQTYLLHYKEKLVPNKKTDEFLELLSQVPLLCRTFLPISFSPNSVHGTKSTGNLDSKKENLESASLCFDLTLACLEAFRETEKGLIMLKISLNILSQGYAHCKESEMIYGELLEEFANQLGYFFKKIENLQIVVLQELDKLDIKKYSSGDLLINCIVLEMGNLCQVVFSLDADIAFELWTHYIRIISAYDSLKQISNINSFSAYLASKNVEVLEMMKYNLDKNSEEDEELCSKFFFYFDALSRLLNLVNDTFKENVAQFRMFLLNLFDCLVSSYSPINLEKSCLNIVRNSLEKNTFTVLSYLYTDEEFLKSVLSSAPDKQNHISVYMLKLCAVQFMKCSTLQLKEIVLKDILSNFLSATSEDDMKLLCVSIPLCVVTQTKFGSISLYQFAYEQLSEFSKLLPDSAIRELENTIIDCLVSSSDVIYLLISDVWMYRLRCSSIEFLQDRCYSMLQNYREKNFKNIKIENITKRMLRFLPLSYREMLRRESSCLKLILDSKSIEHRYGVPDFSPTEAEIYIDSEEQIKTMMSKLNECSNDITQLVQKACICLELCALFLNIAESSEVLQFSKFANELFKSGVYEIQIAVLTFIKALSRKSIPEHTQEFGNLVICLAQLFTQSMHSKNYIVRYEARNVFSYFAKCTPHVRIVQETIRRDPSLKPALKAYINAVPDNKVLSAKEKNEYLQKQILASNNTKFEIPEKIVQSLKVLFSKSTL